VLERLRRRIDLERNDLGEVSRKENDARLASRQAELSYGKSSAQFAAAERRFAEVQEWAAQEDMRIKEEIAALNRENDRYQIRLTTVGGKDRLPKVAIGTLGLGVFPPGSGALTGIVQLSAEKASRQHALPFATIVRAYPANRLALADKAGIYFSRWWEFLSERPREANTEGGVFPAIWGTVAMTLLMSLVVVPFGVLAALYLREYAKSGPIISAVRIAINNLAGVPSIVFGVFGLGFFCYVIGGHLIDPYFYQAKLPGPTFGTGGLFWAALTLALLTVPVVIVSTEEALAAVPNSMREGSYACGASKWQTIRRIVLPRAMPGIMTGMILAMARGAGEVAPLMLVGAVKLAPELPVDGVFPFLHAERSFMHLGFHIYDVGFQSPNSEAARPMVYTTTLLLIAVIALLNLMAVWLRYRLRKRYVVSQF
jgi:phosphate transport system permease protein